MDSIQIATFLKESLEIEGILRLPTLQEIESTLDFLELDVTVDSVIDLQQVYAPEKPIRDETGMDVRVGTHLPPKGGLHIPMILEKILEIMDPWGCHVQFELLHPFMDGNGRVGRTLWAKKMLIQHQDPFSLSFLHRFYYQTLEHQQGT